MTLPIATALHNAGVISVHGCLLACPGGPHIRECEDLRNAIEVETQHVERIRVLTIALRAHRGDLHNGSKRPCPTCRISAFVLGVSGAHCPMFGEGYPSADEIASVNPAFKNWR